jgi:hypothetical protein
MAGLSDRYSYFTVEARRDAEALIEMGVSPFRRPYTSELGDWLRDLAD